MMSLMVGVSLGAPLIDNPYLSILINRRDLGHSFDLGVNRVNHNLVITGTLQPILRQYFINTTILGPPAPYVSFPGTATYYQRSYGHVKPFLAFGPYQGGYSQYP